MSEPITVTVTSLSPDTVKVNGSSSQSVTILNGGAVNVAVGSVSPGNATVVSGTLTINSTTTLAANQAAYAKNVGTAYAASLDLGIPAGSATLVSVGNTTTLASGSNATVTSNVSGSNLTLAFGIPRGANGTNGVTPSFAIGNVTTGAAGSSASVTATATNSGANVTLDLTIPRGDPGTSGSNGTNGTSITLSDGTPANLGTAAAGSSTLAARADHIHNLPVIAYVNLSGTPSNFPTNTTLVSGLAACYSGINHAHNYVTSLNNLTGGLTLAAGSNVTLTTNGSTLTLSSTGGITDNDSIDGGDYTGVVIAPSGLTITQQPQNTTATATSTASNWTSRTLPLASPSYIVSVAYGNGTFVAAGVGNGNYLTSPDAVSWTSRSPVGNTSDLTKVYYGGSSFLHAEGLTLRSSADGVSWSALGTLPSYLYAPNVAYGNGIWVAISTLNANTGAGTTIAASSATGDSWTQRTMPIAAVWRGGLCYGNGRFVAIGYQNTTTASTASYAATSTDGVNWSYMTLPANGRYSAVAYGNGRFVAIASGQVAVSSLDGVTWTQRQMPSASQWYGLQFGNGMFVATSANSTTDFASSVNGESWSLGTLPMSGSYYALGYGNNTFVAVDPNSNVSLTMQPTAGNATSLFTVSGYAASGNPVAYQWQKSVDGGGNFTDVNGASSSALTLSNLTTSDNLSRFRAVLSATGSTTVTSQSATLTVT